MTGLPPEENRLVPSGITPLPWVARIATHRLLLREGNIRTAGTPACIAG